MEILAGGGSFSDPSAFVCSRDCDRVMVNRPSLLAEILISRAPASSREKKRFVPGDDTSRDVERKWRLRDPNPAALS